jgi:hypothetical protein
MRRGHVLGAALLTGAMLGCGPNGATVIKFIGVTPQNPQLQQDTVVQFEVDDYRGLPFAGQTVNFTLLSPLTDGGVSGVTVNPTSSVTDKNGGRVQTTLVAVSRVSSVIVVATAGSLTALSPPINFAGGVPSARNFTFQCGEMDGTAAGGIHNIRAYDESRTFVAGVKVNCSAHVADRNGDGIPGVEVSFLAEAGTIEASQTTVTDADGNATILYKTTTPLPLDVPPGSFTFSPWADTDLTHTGDSAHPVDTIAPLWMHPYEWVPNPTLDLATYFNAQNAPFDPRPEPQRKDPLRPSATLNPRDNLVTMIAITSGEEAFTDNDGNGKYNPATDTFTDTTEPFVDSNDNGTWDPGEVFVDTNGDGQWSPKNGKYDSSTLIWAKERILWTGEPTAEDGNPALSLPVVNASGNIGIIVHHCQYGGPVAVLVSDPWFNMMAQDGQGDTCTIGSGTSPAGVSPITLVPVRVFTGIPETYPAADLIEFVIQDATCGVPPDAGIVYPVDFNTDVNCTRTATTVSGSILDFIPTVVTGQVVNP